MNRMMLSLLALIAGHTAPLMADNPAPWGSAEVMEIDYQPQKVLYDLDKGSPEELANILDRVGYLYEITGSDPFEASIIVIIHGDMIPLFAIENGSRYRELMARAQSLTVGNPIEFRMCRAAAQMMDLAPADIHGFVKMVPMADAEIVRLQKQGYAYMR